MNQERKIPPGYIKASFSSDELQNLKSAVLEGRAFWDRISLAFALRLVQAFSNRLGYHQILDELDFLEGLRVNSRTKPAMPFDSPALKPLWHKHFSASRHVLKNIGIRWALDRKGNRDLDGLIGSIAKAGSDRWADQLCHQIVIGGYAERAQRGRLTGDWIIFAKHDRRNYYLDLATHTEGNDGQTLMEKIRLGSEAEFPFLFV